jgi:hypothetical protein
MDTQQRETPGAEPAVPELAGYASAGDWLDRHAGPFFETRSSLDWFIKRNRRELVESGALIPREGRSGSLLSLNEFPKAVIRILRRKALEKVAA